MKKIRKSLCYKYTLPDGSGYIGITFMDCEKSRIGQHRRGVRNLSNDHPLYVAIREQGGWENVKYEVLARNLIHASAYEDKMITKHNTLIDDGFGYNQQRSYPNYGHSKRTRKEMSIQRKEWNANNPEKVKEIRDKRNKTIRTDEYRKKHRLNYVDRMRAVVINGVEYDSISEACRLLGIKKGMLIPRCNSDLPEFADWKWKKNPVKTLTEKEILERKRPSYVHNIRAVVINGVEYESLVKASEFFNMIVNTIRFRCDSPDPKWKDWKWKKNPVKTLTEKEMMHKRYKNLRSLTVNDVEYYNTKHASEVLGIAKNTVSHRCNSPLPRWKDWKWKKNPVKTLDESEVKWNNLEWKKKQSNALKKYFNTDGAREKNSKAQKKRFERPEEREKIREKNSKPVVIDDVVYRSIKEAKQALNMSHGGITKRCNNPNFPNWYFLDK